MNTVRVMIADDHSLVRAGIHALLDQLAEVEVVGEASDGRTAYELVARLRPDLVLSDISMPSLNGLEMTARITKEFPEVRVIILSMHANEEYVLQALRAGASGYLLKSSALAELELAVSAVMNGETYLSPAAAKHLVGDYISRSSVQAPREQEALPGERLTPRQREILQLIAEGKTTKEIANILTISVKTAEMHRAQLMERLDIHDVAGLVRYAIRIGLIDESY
jgi:DNA-binding NarL/FixJ family response regulator